MAWCGKFATCVVLVFLSASVPEKDVSARALGVDVLEFWNISFFFFFFLHCPMFEDFF